MEGESVNWRKSTYSGNGGSSCVEIGNTDACVVVRDTTQNGAGPVLGFTPAAWAAFTDTIKK
jgi:uncharacterized protein DUF397